MRALFLLILLAGLGLAGYPWMSANILERTVGAWPVYDAASGYLPAHVRLEEGDAPLRVTVDMAAAGMRDPASGQAILTLTAATGGKTVLAKALTFADADSRETNPQTQEKIFRDTAGVIETIEPGAYDFTLGRGDAEGISIRHVDLTLHTEAASIDERLQPLGFAAMAVGFIGLVLALRHGSGGGPGNPNSQPPPPRWGRNGTSG